MHNKSYQSSEMGNESQAYNDDPEYQKDFNSAYAKVREPPVADASQLVEKIYQEQGDSKLITQAEIERLERTVSVCLFNTSKKGLSEEDFRTRILDYEDKKKIKIQ